jgi:hypothetical protein
MCVLSLVQDGWRVVREKISNLMVFGSEWQQDQGKIRLGIDYRFIRVELK